MYDDLIIDAPFWPRELIEIDNTPFPKAAVSALAGFNLGALADEIQVIEGLGSLGAESAQTCAQVGSVAGAIASMGVAACSLITNTADRARCTSLVVGAGAGASGLITGAMGCGGPAPTVPVTVRPGTESRLIEQERLAFERERVAAAQRTQNMMLIGGGVAVAAALAFIAFRR